MDMSKAFDMVDWYQLFTSLRKRQLNSVILRLMLTIYMKQKCNVVWNGSPSAKFSVTNGVRQGAVISAILFAIYIDELLRILRDSRLGLHIDGVFFGTFVFADDIFLLSGNVSSLQVMVNKCTEFAKEKNLKFETNVNPDKSKTNC